MPLKCNVTMLTSSYVGDVQSPSYSYVACRQCVYMNH